MALLEVEDLTTTLYADEPVHAVDGVTFSVEPGKVLGLVGESGCGKSITMLSVMQLLPGLHATTGAVRLEGEDLLTATPDRLRQLRGSRMAMVFQDPMTSLNPVHRIGWQLVEAIRLHHRSVTRRAAAARSVEMLAAVGIPSPDQRIHSYPHELSGGMRQRVMIAMAMINNPRLLIADEPTTALDVTTQAQILDLIRTLRRDFDSAVVFVTHDLGVVAELCDDVVVMYAGKIVETASVTDLFARPQHPYTWGLLRSLPGANLDATRLFSLPGSPPSLVTPPAGCRFRSRCEYATEVCATEPTLTIATAPDHRVACHLGPLERDAARARTVPEIAEIPESPA